MYTVELYSNLVKFHDVDFDDKNNAIEWAQKKIDWLTSNKPAMCSYAMVWDGATMVASIE